MLLDHLCLELAAKSGVHDLDQALDVLVCPATCPVKKLCSAIKWHQAISLANLESYRMHSYARVVASYRGRRYIYIYSILFYRASGEFVVFL